MSETRWEHFAHEADMDLRGFGENKAEAFQQAALAMTAVITDLEKLQPNEEIDVNCEAPDDELVFVDWLNAFATWTTRCLNRLLTLRCCPAFRKLHLQCLMRIGVTVFQLVGSLLI